MSDFLRPHGWQHTRIFCPSQSPGVCSISCPLSQWHHPTISSSVPHFSSYPQSFPASGSFPMSQFFALGGQRIGASASVLPMNLHGWFPLELTIWSPCSPRVSQVSSPAPQFESITLSAFSLWVWLLHPYMTTSKTIALIMGTFVVYIYAWIYWCMFLVTHSYF